MIFRSFGGMPFMLRRSSRKCLPASTLISASALVVAHVVERFLRREDDVQALRELLEQAHELEPEILVVEQVEERVVVGQVGEAVRLEPFHDRGFGWREARAAPPPGS